MAQANLAHGPNLGPGPQFKKPCSRQCNLLPIQLTQNRCIKSFGRHVKKIYS